MEDNQDDDQGPWIEEGDFDDIDRPGLSGAKIAKMSTDVEKELDYRYGISPGIPRAARENRPDVLKQLIREGKPIHTHDNIGWTALHHAAFLGHVECVRVLLNEKTCNIDVTSGDGSTPLIAACLNLPKAKDCVKVLCEHKANPNLFTTAKDVDMDDDDRATALFIAIKTMPDLDVIKWLVGAGADVEKYVELEGGGGWCTTEDTLAYELKNDLMWFLFSGEFGYFSTHHPAHIHAPRNREKPELTELAEIAMYLAKHGAANRGHALHMLLLPRGEGYNLRPPLLNEVVDCFLDNGAVLDVHDIFLQDCFVWRPSVLFLFARKSIVFIEGIPTSNQGETSPSKPLNSLMVLMIKGQVSGTLALTDVQEVHDNLPDYVEGRLPTDFRPFEIFKALTKSPPSLRQLARTKIRSQIAECGKFCRENLKKLPGLPEILKEYVQLSDLDQIWIRYASEFENLADLN